MKKILAILAIVLFAGTAMAQEELSFERKQAIDSLALEKVRDLSKYIKIVGSKETAWSEANRNSVYNMKLNEAGKITEVELIKK